ncbi:MAG: desulfoferrodoxin family protein [Desulfosporosinus sp.]|nr:desulfoferrodoxin family protein [Desulfosporosinus sp.]
MNDRRDFLKTTAVAASLIAFSSIPKSFAAGKVEYTNIIFTKENPARWKGKEGLHIPEVTVTGSKVSVVTPHPMSNEHFIVRHTLVLEDGTYVGSKTFTPADKPESAYKLPADYKGKFYVSSACNLHDFWLIETKA